MTRLLLIDGHAFIFRAYYAFQTANLTHPLTGEPTGAVFGFFRMLFKLMSDYAPTHIALTFDPGTPLERSKVYDKYKSSRKPTPEDLKPQIKRILDISEVMEFKIFQVPGQEADDIIGTLCERFKNEVTEILIFSSDKDMYQLLDKNVFMLKGKKGVTEFVKLDEDWVKTEIGISPAQITDYMGIVGDKIDDIPGVSGIGEKGAAKLLAEYQTLDGIYQQIDEIRNPSLKEKLKTNQENAYLSKQLATIKKDIDLNLSLSDVTTPDLNKKEKLLYFKQEGFNQIYKELLKHSGSVETSDMEDVTPPPKTYQGKKGSYIRVKSIEELQKIVTEFKSAPYLSVDTETTSTEPMRAELIGISITNREELGYYIPIDHGKSIYSKSCLPLDETLKVLKPLLESKNIGKIGQNIKYDYIVLAKYGVIIKPFHFDTMLASYVLQPGGRRHNMDDMAEDYLDYKTIHYSDLVGTGKKKQELYDIDVDRVTEYAGEDADITFRLYNTLKLKLEANLLQKIFEEMEMPLIEVIAEMEQNGISIDVKYFQKLSKNFDQKITKLVSSIHEYAGKTFNVASTKELQKVLFDDLKLPMEKKTKTGFSTDHSVLENLQGKHPIIDALLEHRKYTKLKSTYIDTLPQLINANTNRIHTSYNQTIAATGRLSSTDPNLQNIPIKDEEGKLLRKGFVPANQDYLLLSLDYSQIELRIMAHFSQDKRMIDAYSQGVDIHVRTGSGLFGIEEDQVTPEMRNKAKIVNFSVIYGVTPFGLAQNLKISRQEAKAFIDKYFLQYPGVQKYMDDICKSCEEKGYVETITGRRRYIPEIHSKRRQEVEGAKRVAINSPIQGTSADMIKIAMIKIHHKMKKEKLQSKLIMQVHDELVFEVHKSEKDNLYKLAKEEMEKAIPLDVPIVVQGNFGENWEEAH
ncbi:MAG: DNA polymerase I [Leptospiraceae bacterium]|nr:DNA polymerase I [Leptospiraceae bacterium]MCP5493711.1 DNA polymerase I [Leptospiraceae bacterium]